MASSRRPEMCLVDSPFRFPLHNHLIPLSNRLNTAFQLTSYPDSLLPAVGFTFFTRETFLSFTPFNTPSRKTPSLESEHSSHRVLAFQR
jgi:hypothetical protein